MRRDFLKWCASAGVGLATPPVFSGSSRADDTRELPIYDGPFSMLSAMLPEVGTRLT